MSRVESIAFWKHHRPGNELVAVTVCKAKLSRPDAAIEVQLPGGLAASWALRPGSRFGS